MHVSALSMDQFVNGLPMPGKRKADDDTSNITTIKTKARHILPTDLPVQWWVMKTDHSVWRASKY